MYWPARRWPRFASATPAPNSPPCWPASNRNVPRRKTRPSSSRNQFTGESQWPPARNAIESNLRLHPREKRFQQDGGSPALLFPTRFEEPSRAPVVEDGVADGRDEQREEQAEHLATDDDLGHGRATRGARPGAEGDGDHRGHEHEGGHEDGAKTDAIGLKDGFFAFQPALAQGVGVGHLIDRNIRLTQYTPVLFDAMIKTINPTDIFLLWEVQASSAVN